jgi:hypothetical protein
MTKRARAKAAARSGMMELSAEVQQALTELIDAKRALARARQKLARTSYPSALRYLLHEDWAWAHELMEDRGDGLLSVQGVVGFGLGFRRRKGERLRTPCLTVYVERKLPPEELPREAALQKTVSAGGRRLEIDVVEFGRLRRQVGAGDSIGPLPLFERGTLGAFARDSQAGDVVALTAMHIAPQGSIGAEFQSPVPGTPFGTLRAGTMAGIDAAKIALAPQPPNEITVLPSIGRVRGWRPTTFPGDQNTPVRLFGASSGFHTGTIVTPATAIPAANLEAAILVDIQTQDGDSGSALVDPENLLLGFLVGRGSTELNRLAVFTPASLVLSRLGCAIPSV